MIILSTVRMRLRVYLRLLLTYGPLVVAQHNTRLDLISQGGDLVPPKHGIDERKNDAHESAKTIRAAFAAKKNKSAATPKTAPVA